MGPEEVSIEYIENLSQHSEKALETAQAALNRDIETYDQLTDIEGPEDASNYFGVLRHFLKQEMDNGALVVEHLWNHGVYHSTHNPLERNRFSHYQEVVQTLENLEHYCQNISSDRIEEGEYQRGLEEAEKWVGRLDRSLSEMFRVV